MLDENAKEISVRNPSQTFQYKCSLDDTAGCKDVRMWMQRCTGVHARSRKLSAVKKILFSTLTYASPKYSNSFLSAVLSSSTTSSSSLES